MHYSLIVITEEPYTVGYMMCKFEEQWKSHEPYTVWVNETDEYRRKYETGTTDFVYNPDAEHYALFSPYDERFRKPEFKDSIGFCTEFYEVPDTFRRVKVPMSVMFPDFDTYMREWHEMELNEVGEYGHWENPNGKWDWYQVGGRWTGLIEATDGEYGGRSWCNEGEPYEAGHYDTALMADVTFIDPSCVHDVLTPDGVWHECETWHEELKSDEHPWGTFVKDPTFKTDFKKRFLDPYPHCRVTVVDYHC